ncbi:MAG: hypothetical protein R3E96_04085 [Planctomycetota bacterium]
MLRSEISGFPLLGCEVRLQNQAGETLAQAHCDAEGIFELSWPENGPQALELRTRIVGHADLIARLQRTGGDRDFGEFRVPAGITLTGQAQDEHGGFHALPALRLARPVSGSEGPLHPLRVLDLPADAEGIVQASAQLVTGLWRVHAAPGASIRSQELHLPAGELVFDWAPEFANPVGAIGGSMHTREGAPVAGQVVALDGQGATLGTAEGDADGRFVLEPRVPSAEPAWLEVRAPSMVPWRSMDWVAWGTQEMDIQLEPVRGARIVVMAGDLPLQHGVLRWAQAEESRGAASGELSFASQTEQGIHLPMIPEGPIRLTLEPSDPNWGPLGPVTLFNSGPITPLIVQLAPRRTLTLQIEEASGQPVTGAIIECFASDGTCVAQQKSDGEGRVQIALGSPTPALVRCLARGLPPIERTIPAPLPDPWQWTLPTGGTHHGRCEGWPRWRLNSPRTRAAWILAQPTAGKQTPLRADLDPTGDFLLAPLASGRWRLELHTLIDTPEGAAESTHLLDTLEIGETPQFVDWHQASRTCSPPKSPCN